MKNPVVTKQRKNDCGVCAVANILGITWEEAAKLVFPFDWNDRKKYGTTAKQIGLALYSIPAPKLRVAGDWKWVPDRSIVKVMPHHKKYGNWHWVAKIDGMVVDNGNPQPMLASVADLKYRMTSYVTGTGFLH